MTPQFPEGLPEPRRALIRPYMLTAGRPPVGSVQLDLISVVLAVRPDADDDSLEPEQRAVLQMCREPLSVAEIAAHVALPIAVVKVLIADLADRGHVVTRSPHPPDGFEIPVSRNVLETILDGLQRL